MDEAVEPVVPLGVHRIALTTINVPDPDGTPHLFPVIGVWANLEPLRAAGVEFRQGTTGVFPVVVMTDSVLDAINPAMMTVVMTQAHTTGEAHAAHVADAARSDDPGRGGSDQEVEVSTFGPHWSVRVPTSWVAMATVVMGTPLQLRIVLIDGLPPYAPDEYLLSASEESVVVMPAYSAVHETLGRVMGPEWTAPIPMQMEHSHDLPPINLMRDLLWANLAGVALGQERALNRAIDYAELVARFERGTPDEQAKCEAALQAAGWMAESSQLEPLARDSDGQVIWPLPILPLVDKIAAAVDEKVLHGLDQGLSFEDAVETFGVHDSLVALSVLAAARANSAAANVPPDEVDQGRYTPAYLLGMWLDEECDVPRWATLASHHLLLHHDTEVLVNLLACNPRVRDLSEGHSPLTVQFLHVLAEALSAWAMSPQEFTARVGRLDLSPPGIEDIVYVCQRLLALCADNDAGQQCPGCGAVEGIVAEIVDQHRLVRAAAGAVAVLADLDAEMHGLVVGEEDWKSHRDGYLMHWLSHTVLVGSEN